MDELVITEVKVAQNRSLRNFSAIAGRYDCAVTAVFLSEVITRNSE